MPPGCLSGRCCWSLGPWRGDGFSKVPQTETGKSQYKGISVPSTATIMVFPSLESPPFPFLHTHSHTAIHTQRRTRTHRFTHTWTDHIHAVTQNHSHADLTRTHRVTHIHRVLQTHTHRHTLTHTLPPSHTYTHSQTPAHRLSHTIIHTQSHTHIDSHAIIPTHRLTHTPPHTSTQPPSVSQLSASFSALSPSPLPCAVTSTGRRAGSQQSVPGLLFALNL